MTFRSLASFCSISLLVLGAAACAEESESKPAPKNQATVNTVQAKEAAKQAIAAAITAVKSGDGQSAANQLQGAASQMQGVITPSGGAAGMTPATAGSAGALAAGTCTCDQSQCTFQDCGDNGVTVNGTMSWSGGHLLCDLTYHITDSGNSTLDCTTTCDLTVTDTSIDGTLGSTGSLEGNAGVGEGGGTGDGAGTGYAYSFSWTSSTAYKAVTFDGSGTPTGGSIDVSGTYEVAGQKYEGSATITFP